MPLLLNDLEVEDLLRMEDAMEVVEEAFRQLAVGGASMVARITTPPPDAPGQYYLRWLMPGTIHSMGVMGAKILVAPSPGDAPGGPTRLMVFLFDSNDGSLLAAMSGRALSTIKTGAVTGVGTKYLARPDSRTLGIIGSTRLAEAQAVAVSIVRSIERIKVYSPTPAHRERCARAIAKTVNVDVTAVDTSDEAVSGSDIVVTATNSKEPVFRGELLEPGTHLNVIGSSLPDHREVDDHTIRSSKIVAEHVEQALMEAGDLVIPIRNGVMTPADVYGEISEIVAGKKPGRESAEEITLFKTNGIAVEDIACAFTVYQRAGAQGIGQEINAI